MEPKADDPSNVEQAAPANVTRSSSSSLPQSEAASAVTLATTSLPAAPAGPSLSTPPGTGASTTPPTGTFSAPGAVSAPFMNASQPANTYPPNSMADTNTATVQSIKTPPSLRPSSLLYPPDPPFKLTQDLESLTQPDIEHSNPITMHFDHPAIATLPKELAEHIKENFDTLESLLKDLNLFKDSSDALLSAIGSKGYQYDVKTNCFYETPKHTITNSSTATAGTDTLAFQTPPSDKPPSLSFPPDPPHKLTPQPKASKVVRNLNPLFQPFQPSPTHTHLLHSNHVAVRLLLDVIVCKIRRQIRNELNAQAWKNYDKNDVRIKEAIHGIIMDTTKMHQFTYDHFEKRFHPPY